MLAIMNFIDLVDELENKLEARRPGTVQPLGRPATPADLHLAETLHGAELTDEIVALALRHNGCSGYPMGHAHAPLPRSVLDMQIGVPLPLAGGPFHPRSTALTLGDGMTFLVTPLDGEYRGHVFRMNTAGHHYSCYAAGSLAEIFESWIFYLDNDFLTDTPHNLGFVPAGSEWAKIDGGNAFDLVLPAWPNANPLSITSLVQDASDEARAFVQGRQTPYGMDPAINPHHPDHAEWWERNMASSVAYQAEAAQALEGTD